MTTQVPPLQWIPYQAGKPGSLFASVVLDSSIDTNYTININGKYNNQDIFAQGVVCNNTNNNGTVSLVAGQLIVSIVPFSRDYMLLDKNVALNLGVNVTVGIAQLFFYVGTPPFNPSLINQAAANALANSNVFIGTPTTGLPNAQVMSVGTTFAFSQGVLLSGVTGMGLANTGPVTMTVNGTPFIVTKNSNAGSVPLQGGEFQANVEFLLACNGVTGSLDLISDIPIAYRTAFLPGNIATGAMNNFQTAVQVPQGAGGVWKVDGSMLLRDSSIGASFAGRVTDGATIYGSNFLVTSGAGIQLPLPFAGVICSNPIGNLRLQAADLVTGNGFVDFNASGQGLDTWLTATRIG